MNTDLRKYVADKAGTWADNPESFSANRLLLSNEGDGVVLVGPLRVRVSLQGENVTQPFWGDRHLTLGDRMTALSGVAIRASATAAVNFASQQHIVYTYDLDIPPLQAWSYLVQTGEIIGALGTNRGFNVVIQPGISELCTPSPSSGGCKAGCGCGGSSGCG